jgi:hypothetical protein
VIWLGILVGVVQVFEVCSHGVADFRILGCICSHSEAIPLPILKNFRHMFNDVYDHHVKGNAFKIMGKYEVSFS